MAVAHDEPMMDLIRARLANSERPLTRLLRVFYRLATLTPDDQHPGHLTSDDQTFIKEYHDRLYIHHAQFILELNSFTRSLSESKGIRMLQMTARELEGLEHEKARLQSEALSERSRIAKLELELEEAKRERKNKIQYEEIGKEVRRYGDRFQSAIRINGLAQEINNLLEEQRLYAERWTSRRDQFNTVVAKLEVLQESIREEKADADRKKALNDDDVDDDEGRPGDDEEADRSGPGEPSKPVAEADADASPNLDGSPSIPNGDEDLPSQRPATLNPCAIAFFPDETIQNSTGSTPDNFSRSGARHANGTPQPIERPSSRTDHNAMDVDHTEGRDPVTEVASGPLLDEDATMEDGEEREEVEEGQEMERE